MVVYVDGQPIFVKHPDASMLASSSLAASEKANKKQAAKIPYLLAVAAATASSNHREQQTQMGDSSQFRPEKELRVKSRKRLHSQTSADSKEGSDTEQDYFQLVSMFKQKNQKLSHALFK